MFSASYLLSTANALCVLEASTTQNVGDRWTVGVSLFTPNGAYIFRPVLDNSEDRRMVDYGPQAPINTTSHSGTAQMAVSNNARCCLLMLMGGRVVTLCSLAVVCCLPGT